MATVLEVGAASETLESLERLCSVERSASLVVPKVLR